MSFGRGSDLREHLAKSCVSIEHAESGSAQGAGPATHPSPVLRREGVLGKDAKAGPAGSASPRVSLALLAARDHPNV